MESVMIRVCCAIFKTSQNVEKNDPFVPSQENKYCNVQGRAALEYKIDHE